MRSLARNTGCLWRRACAAGLMASAALAFSANAAAAEIAVPAAPAIALPSEVADAESPLRLLGRGTLRFFGLMVYEARLWAAADFVAGRFDAHAFALELIYARKLEGAAIAQRSIVEMRRSGSVTDSQAQAWLEEMARAFPDIKPGDRLTGVHTPGAATRFFFNGKLTTAVADSQFARSFFGIWLAAGTSEPGLRQQLIGQGS
ncbi:MAG: chalcone isomerase family protein [Burkholderiales bacterium]|jgi:hypothetical protein|nr:chalcone isomerase family protein [Burkholderiales bacterium]